MKPCRDFETLLIDRAAGDLQEEAMEMLSQHLARCEGCAAEAAMLEETLRWVALPARTAEERAAMASLPLRTAVAWHRVERRRSTVQGAAAGFMAAAAAAALVFVPIARQRSTASRPAELNDSTAVELELVNWAIDPYGDSILARGGDLGPLDRELDDERE